MAFPVSRMGLRARLLVLVGAAIIPALGVILYAGLENRFQGIEEAKSRARHLARTVSKNHEELILQTRLLLRLLARHPDVQGKNQAACSALFTDLIKQFPGYLNLGLAGPDGGVVCSGVPLDGRVVNLSDRRYFQRAAATGGFTVGDFQMGRITGKASVNFGHPVFEEAKGISGVVFAALDLAWLAGGADRSLLPVGSRFALVDREGRILARLPENGSDGRIFKVNMIQRMLNEGRTTTEWMDLKGEKWLAGFALVGPPLDGIYALVDSPMRVALRDADRALLRNLVALGMVAVFALAAAWVGGGWFLRRPIERLLDSAQRMSEGDLKVRTGLPHEGSELNRLARAFDGMTESLEQAAKDNQRKQELVFRSEKLASMGLLMAGAAHEVLNPANIIGLHAQRLVRDHSEGTQERKAGEIIWASVQRITDICGGLRRFSRDDAPKSAPLSPTRTVDDCIQLLAHRLRLNSVRVRRLFEDGEAKVMGDRNRFMQVFLNLISNAVDAMPGSGTLTVRTQVVEADEKRWWEGRFTDTGAGIPLEVMPKIFDPFFTTKPEDQGTGLGLPVSRQIAEAHGGKLWAESPSGEGATLIIRFPLPEG